ncbi:FAR1-related sequence 7 [Euphorbia peplus]|nr:FAR1-related sequence 7 [Euphorbia peplus]
MGFHPGSGIFSNVRNADAIPIGDECGNAYPLRMIRVVHRVNGQADEEDSEAEPCIGLEFDSADDAHKFYSLYATRVGFRTRTGQLYRSRSNGSVSSRRYVCAKEGFQLNSRTGCPAFIRVHRRDSGKWVIDQVNKEHNHELGLVDESQPPVPQQRAPRAKKLSADEVSERPKLENLDNGLPCRSGVVNIKRVRREPEEPRAGLIFNSADEAYSFYQMYAETAGFKVRIGQLFRSTKDGSVTSRRFVCSKEGFQHPSRLGCGAFMRIKRQESGNWIVDRLLKDHNHDLQLQTGTDKKSSNDSKKFVDDANLGLDIDLDKMDYVGPIRTRENDIGSDWYQLFLNYFQTRQAEDTGFFYSVELHGACCMSVFWADGRSRFSCSQFGDAVIFDTSYRKGNYVVPFATFVGINHHKQPVLLACALIANMSEESLTWLFRTWLRAMNGCIPKCFIADQDETIQQAIAKVFLGSHHRFSMWQFRAKEQEILRSLSDEFKYEYEKCIYQCQTSVDFSTMWSAFVDKYGLKENTWLKEMYENRERWVPLYLRGKFCAGIPISEGLESYFGTFLNAQTALVEFVSQYEQGLMQRREEEKKEDFHCYNLQVFLLTKEPVEEQCRKLYTLSVFKIFQSELLQSYNYLGLKTYEEGNITRYSVRKCGDEAEKHAVTLCESNLNVCCSCQMFEFEGILCRHVLRVFNLLDIREIPSRYILHRWTRNAVYGTICDVESGVSPQELKSLITWSLRETACKYIEAGSKSLVKYKVAYETLREGGKRLRWQR